MTIPELDEYSYVYGIYNSSRNLKPYNDLKEVLNMIGVMAKRDKLPFGCLPSVNPKVRYSYYPFTVKEYYVPKNWRDCLYEDLQSRQYYIISPDPDNEKENPERIYSWIAFRVTEILHGLRFVDENHKLRNVYHTGSFVELLKTANVNEVLDTLAENEKPIKTTIKEEIKGLKDKYYYICQFDID